MGKGYRTLTISPSSTTRCGVGLWVLSPGIPSGTDGFSCVDSLPRMVARYLLYPVDASRCVLALLAASLCIAWGKGRTLPVEGFGRERGSSLLRFWDLLADEVAELPVVVLVLVEGDAVFDLRATRRRCISFSLVEEFCILELFKMLVCCPCTGLGREVQLNRRERGYG